MTDDSKRKVVKKVATRKAKPKAKAKAKPPGRAPGSKNLKRVQLVTTPASCSKCGSTEILRRKISRVKLHNDVINGKSYNVIVWRHANCKACKQAISLRSHEKWTTQKLIAKGLVRAKA